MPEQGKLDIYLGDHCAGATAGAELARRLAGSEPQLRELERIAGEIEADRETLGAIMTATGVSTPLLKVAIGWIGEKAGRLKLNDRVFGRSPLSAVLELEGLIAGVSGKLQLWRALSVLSSDDRRLDGFDFESLAVRAEDQRRGLEEIHAEAVTRALATAPHP